MFCASVIQRKGSSYIIIVSVIKRNGSIVGNTCFEYNLVLPFFVRSILKNFY